MIANCIIGLFVMAAAFLSGSMRAHAEEPPGKKEVPTPAKEIVKMKVQRVLSEKHELSRAEKTIEDKERIGQLLALFPQVGTDKEPDARVPKGGARLSGAAFIITLHRGKAEPLHIVIGRDRDFWSWSEGKAQSTGVWDLENAKEVGKFHDELLK